jgi:hypothetical protein
MQHLFQGRALHRVEDGAYGALCVPSVALLGGTMQDRSAPEGACGHTLSPVEPRQLLDMTQSREG